MYENCFLDFIKIIRSNLTYYRDRMSKGRVKEVNVTISEIENAIERGLKWLKSMQRADGSIGERLYEIWETANAALAFILTGKNGSVVEKALEFVKLGQLEDGSFFHRYLSERDKHIGWYCIETSSVAAITLYKYEGYSETVKKAIDFIKNSQNENGSWYLPHLRYYQDYPSVTGYAIKALLAVDTHVREENIKKAIDWLESRQNKNGNWGSVPNYYNVPGYAMKNICEGLMLAIRKSIGVKEQAEGMLRASLSYALRFQNPDGSWPMKGESSKNLETALQLQTLANCLEAGVCNASEIKTSVKSGLHWLLLNQREDGSWYGGKLFGRNVDVFVTSEVLFSLVRFLVLPGIITT